jgi:hypothetical protein
LKLIVNPDGSVRTRNPVCSARIEGSTMIGVIIAAILYASLIYICGRYTAKYAAQRGTLRSCLVRPGRPALSFSVYLPRFVAAAA